MKKYLFLITIFYFALSFINIHFAILGLICMFAPFVLLFKNKKKTWCQNYCPRSSLYTVCGKLKKISNKAPSFLTKGGMKWIILTYFSISLLMIIISTAKVAMGMIEPIKTLKFLMLVPIPAELPQLIEFSNVAPWFTHFAYRFYSMMMTTTVLGLILAVLYKPRTWCTICPISTLSQVYLNTKKES